MSTRAERLIGGLDGAGVDLMLVTNLVNVRYLTGYTGSNGLALIGPNTRVFLTDFRYTEQAEDEVDPEFERVTGRTEPDHRRRRVPARGHAQGRLRVGEHDRRRARAHARAVPGARRAGCRQGTRREHAPGQGRAGDRADRRGLADRRRRARGAARGRPRGPHRARAGAHARARHAAAWRLESPSFDSIVAAGPHGALPHATPRDVKIERGQLVVIDWGALSAATARTARARSPSVSPARRRARPTSSCSAPSRSASTRSAPAATARRSTRRCATSSTAPATRATTATASVTASVSRSTRRRRSPFRSDDTLQAGNVVTVEPGVYLPGKFGIRIEDLVVVTDDGIRILTSIPKALRIVD